MTEQNQYHEYSLPQFRSALRLARAFGHGWAEVPGSLGLSSPTDHPVAGARWTMALVEELYRAIGRAGRWESWQYGISSPGPLNSSGCVTHVTMTGRMEWRIDPDGVAGVVVCRPGPSYLDEQGVERHRSLVVLSAVVDYDGGVEIRTADTKDGRIPDVHTATWSPVDGPRAEARHGDALRGVLAAMVGDFPACAAMRAAGVLWSDGQIEVMRPSAP